MLWLRPFTWVNRNGSAAIASTGVAVNTANVVFTWFERDTNTLQLMTGIV